MTTGFRVALLALLALAPGGASAAEIRVAGTGASLGLLQRLRPLFEAAQTEDTLSIVPGLGSSGAILAVHEGALDLSVSSRALKREEADKGLRSEPFLATPFVFVTTHPQGHAISRSSLVSIYDGTLTKWPDGTDIKPLLRPRSESATGFLGDRIPGMREAMEKLRQRSDIPVAATDQDNVGLAQAVPGSFTGATLLQVVTEKPRLHMLAFEGVQPSLETLERDAYPLKIELLLVTPAEPSPAARRFLAFLRSPKALKTIRDSGGMPIPRAG